MIRIIRSKHSPAQEPSESDPRFVDVSDEIDTLLAEARDQAQGVLAEAEREADEIRQQAHQQGLADARQQHREAVQAEVDQRLQALLPAIQAAVAAIDGERIRQLQCWEQNLIRLAVAIAERIVRCELQQQPRIQLEWIREALELAAGSPTIKLHLHPTDQKALEEPLRGVLASLGDPTGFEILADPEIGRGGCVVETEHGCIDQQLETQLSRIQDELV